MNLASYLIKGEINRFECVHPCIYASYDILDGMNDVELSNRIRDHLISIEDAFVHSQEWTLSRSVSEIKIACIGSANSGKSALIHFFLTGVYVQDESPEGGRFKKLYFSHSQPQLLLIRDEASAPDIQLASWADALIVVVSLADIETVRLASEYYAMFCGLRDNLDIPIMLVATQDALANGTPSSAIEPHIRQLLSSMNWCPYYQTCAVYGSNVEPIFQEIVSRVLLQRNGPQSATFNPTNDCTHSRSNMVLVTSPNPSHTGADPTTQQQKQHSLPPTNLPSQTHPFNTDHQADSVSGSRESPIGKQDHSGDAVHARFPSNVDMNKPRVAHPCEILRPPSLVSPLMPSYPPLHCFGLSQLPISDSSYPLDGTGKCPPALQLLQPQLDNLGGQTFTLLPTDAALHSSWIHSKAIPAAHFPPNSSLATHANGLTGPFSSMALSNHSIGTLTECQTQPPLALFSSTTSSILGQGLQFVLPNNRPVATGTAADEFYFGHSGPGQMTAIITSSSHAPRLVECALTGSSHCVSQAQPRRLSGVPRGYAEAEHSSPRSVGPGGAAASTRLPDCSPRDQHQPHHSERRDRPRPQSTGSLSGPITGLTSTTVGMNNLSGAGGNSAGMKQQPRDNLGAGRLIPLKQGYLYKRSTKGLVKESRKRKKKYVVITEDARLCYHPSKQDYVNSQHGKSIDLTISTIKLPGMAYRMSSCATASLVDSGANAAALGSSDMSSSMILPSPIANASITSTTTSSTSTTAMNRTSLTGTSTPKQRPHPVSQSTTLSESQLGSYCLEVNSSASVASDLSGTNSQTTNDSSTRAPSSSSTTTTTASSSSTAQAVRTGGRTLREAMKRHYKRAKAAMVDNSTDNNNSNTENHDFIIVTADNTQWHFEAQSADVRDEWIRQIDAVIHQRLRSGAPVISRLANALDNPDKLTPQTGRSGRPLSTGTGSSGVVESLVKIGGGEDVCGQEEVLQRLSALAGNDCCADCGAPNPEWASLNLVVLICIECSGVHRELGTHISRVRSATLDTWTREHLAVMASFGNTLANSVWEASAPSKVNQFKKPEPTSNREVRSAWIQNKYLRRLFLPPLPHTNRPVQQELVDALVRRDARTLLLCLAVGGSFAPQPATGHDGTAINLNAAYSADDSRNPLHFAAILGDLASLQLLIWHGLDVNVADCYGLTAWSYAHVCRQDACTRLLQVNGCPTVSPLGVPADWLQRMRTPFPITATRTLVSALDGNVVSCPPPAPSPLHVMFNSSDSESNSSSSSSSSCLSSSSQSEDTDDQRHSVGPANSLALVPR